MITLMQDHLPASLARLPRGATGDEAWRQRDGAGSSLPFVEARVVAQDGTILSRNRTSADELEVLGPSVDPAKDVIKSRGRWISSVELEGRVRVVLS